MSNKNKNSAIIIRIKAIKIMESACLTIHLIWRDKEAKRSQRQHQSVQNLFQIKRINLLEMWVILYYHKSDRSSMILLMQFFNNLPLLQLIVLDKFVQCMINLILEVNGRVLEVINQILKSLIAVLKNRSDLK